MISKYFRNKLQLKLQWPYYHSGWVFEKTIDKIEWPRLFTAGTKMLDFTYSD